MTSMDTVLLIDGENLKGKIKAVFKEVGKEKPLWPEYNFHGLFDRVLRGIKINRKVDCVYLGFEAQPNKGLSYTINRTILIRNSELFEFEKV